MPNLYERGRRDGSRGLERAIFADHPAHELWATHLAYHGFETEPCGLECEGLEHLPEELRKVRRQVPEALPNSRHVCGECGASFRAESRADERAEYDSGFEAGRAQYARDQQRRRSDQQRRARRRRR